MKTYDLYHTVIYDDIWTFEYCYVILIENDDDIILYCHEFVNGKFDPDEDGYYTIDCYDPTKFLRYVKIWYPESILMTHVFLINWGFFHDDLLYF